MNKLFGKRAVEAFIRNAKMGMVDGNNFNRIMKCDHVDVSPLECFLDHEKSHVRMSVVQLIGKKGNARLLVERLGVEVQPLITHEMLLRIKSSDIELLEGELVFLLEHEYDWLREAAIQMFRVKKPDVLFPLVFDCNNMTVQRVKRYLHEKEAKDRASSDS